MFKKIIVSTIIFVASINVAQANTDSWFNVAKSNCMVAAIENNVDFTKMIKGQHMKNPGSYDIYVIDIMKNNKYKGSCMTTVNHKRGTVTHKQMFTY